MKKTVFLIPVLGLTMLFTSCTNNEKKARELMYKYMEQVDLGVERSGVRMCEMTIEAMETILKIEDDAEFIRALDFWNGDSDEFVEFKEEVKKSRKKFALEFEMIETKADNLEDIVEKRARRLDVR